MRKKIFLFVFCLLNLKEVNAQSGVFLNSLYTSSTYWTEGANGSIPNSRIYVYPKVDTTAAKWNSLVDRVYKFPSALAYNCYDSIKVKNSFYYDDSMNAVFNYYHALNPTNLYRQTNPCQYLIFDLGGIRDTSYNTFTPKSGLVAAKDTEICFFIIPGSNNNQTTEIMKGIGYHNSNCDIVQNLKKHGDVYVYTKPNEDYRAIRILANPNKKMQTDLFPTDSYLNSTLNIKDRKDGINIFIQCMATIKELRRKYKKVMVLGCSQGGYTTLLASLESNVDGSIISSGYSIKLDDNILQFGNMLIKYGLFSQFYQKDSIISRITKQRTNYFFTWPYFDSPIYQNENQFHYTENYFGNTQAISKSKFYYTYYNHAFPGCSAIDSMVNEIKFKSKAFITDTLNSCFQNSIIRKIELIGKPPFTYSIYRNNLFLTTRTITTKLDTFNFSLNGEYQIRNIIDVDGVVGLNSDVFNFKKQKQYYFNIDSTKFNCITLKTEAYLSMKGESPYEIKHFKNGILDSTISTTDTLLTLLLENGNHKLVFKDNTNCSLLSDSVSFNYENPNFELISKVFNCQSALTELAIQFSGLPPFQLNYTKNGQALSQNISTKNYTMILQNGLYHLNNFYDNNDCLVIIDTSLNIQSYPFSYTVSNPIFHCDSNKTKIDFTFAGNPPFKLFYHTNGFSRVLQTASFNVSLFLNSGTFSLDSIKDNQCTLHVFPIDTLVFNFQSINMAPIVPAYICDSSKVLINAVVNGNPPFTLFSVQNGNVILTTIPTNNFQQHFYDGLYNFVSIQDSTNCVKSINQAFYFDYNNLTFTLSEPVFICDSNKTKIDFDLEGNPPFKIYYRRNNIQSFITSTSKHFSHYFTNGQYDFDSIEDATCKRQIIPALNYNINNSVLGTALSPAVYDCAVEKVKLDFNFQGNPPWRVHYLKLGGNTTFFEELFYSNQGTIYFPTGNYLIDSISDNTNCAILPAKFVNNNYTALNIQKTNSVYNCDSAKVQIEYSIQGDGPFEIVYLNLGNNQLIQKFVNDTTFTLFLDNGQYIIQTIKDLKCTKIINDTITNNIPELISSLATEAISCDTNKTFVVLSTSSGVPPFTYDYVWDNQTIYFSSSKSKDTLYLDNGNYFFKSITDSLGCVKTYNYALTADYNPYFFHGISKEYNCEKDSTLIKLDIQNIDDVRLKYTLNGLAQTDKSITSNEREFYVGNGTYHWISLSDIQGCTRVLDSLQLIANYEPQLIHDTLYANCNSKLYDLKLNLVGNSPWKLNYIKNNLLESITSDTTYLEMNLSNGSYNFYSIIDSNECQISLDKNFVLNPFMQDSFTISLDNKGGIIAKKTSFNVKWFINNQLVPNESSHYLLPYYEGLYHAEVIDSAGCVYQSNIVNLEFEQGFNLYPNPATDQIYLLSNDFDENLEWTYSIYDATGRGVLTGEGKKKATRIDVSALAKGIYNVQINSSSVLERKKYTMRFIKY